MKQNNLRSSQQSSNYVDYRNNLSQDYTGYGWIFEEDLCTTFSIALTKRGEKRDFYKIESNSTKLRELLECNEYGFLEYKLDDLLEQNMCDLMYYGKAFVEVIRWYDEDNCLSKISFLPFHYVRQVMVGEKIYFQLKRSNGEKHRGKIERKDVIVFSLTDLGYAKRSLRKAMEKLNNIKIVDDTMMLKQAAGYDIKADEHKCIQRVLKITKRFAWPGRMFSSEFVSDPYMYYRNMKFSLTQKKILDYLMQGYNRKLEELGKEYGFEGKITYQCKTEGYEQAMEDLRNGKMNCEDVGKVVF